MARVFITGSADGLGLLAAKALVDQGCQVVLHARNPARGQQALAKVPGAETVLTADLSNIEETIGLADAVNQLGAFDAVIHNAGVYRSASKEILAVNTLAPYILTSLIKRPKRLIYLSSGMHRHGKLQAGHFKSISAPVTYSDSKLHVLMLALAVARLWPGVISNSLDPGWVPTKMGGAGAPDDLQKGYQTQVWLATSNDKEALVTGRYFHHKKERPFNREAGDEALQEQLLAGCAELTGVVFTR